MGGRKKSKVGNRYYMGSALVACRQADALLEIKTKDNVQIWSGVQGQGSNSANRPGAFGGDEREGGFSGKFDVNLGGVDQPRNDYMSRVLGPLTSAMRGVVSIIYNQPYVSANTARLPVLWHKMLNVSGIHRGWLPGLSLIAGETDMRNVSFYIAMDMSQSMTATRIDSQSTAVANFVRSLKGTVNNIKLVTHSNTIISSIQRLNCTDQDYEDIALFVEDLDVSDTVPGGDWNAAVSEAAAFYAIADSVQNDFTNPSLFGSAITQAVSISNGEAETKLRKILIFTTDGEPNAGTADAAAVTLSAIDDLEVAVFNIDVENTTESEKIDNTHADGVPVVTGDNPDELIASLNLAFTSWVDMNPAHILRCLRTDPMRGGTVPESELGDSWAEAAQQFFDEKFGLSPKFRGIDLVLEDIQEIERHADCITFPSQRTGKWEIALIRDDYDVEDLPILDSSIVMDWSGLTRPAPSEIPNKLVVNFTKRLNGETGSVQRTNPVGVRRDGRIIPAKPANYPAITRASLATSVCLRDLRSVTKRIYTGTLPLTYLPPDIEPGGRVILREPLLKIDIVAVVSETRDGGSESAQAWITVSEDKYSTPPVNDDISFDEVIRPEVLPVTRRVVTESNYYTTVFENGQETTDLELETEPDLGRLFVTGVAPRSDHIDFSIGLDTGEGLVDIGIGEFQAYGVILQTINANALQTTVVIESNDTLVSFEAGSLALIGDEIIRVDSFDVVDDELVMTFGRACLDTVIDRHLPGDAFILVSVTPALESTYIAGQSVDVRLISRTNSERLPVFQAPEDTVVFASRAIRPYPVGYLRIEGSYVPDGGISGNIDVTWAHRDRTLQTTPNVEDHSFSSIGPEIGVTYTGVKRIFPLKTDFFSGSDFFNQFDLFIDYDKFYEFDETITPNDGTTWTTSVDDETDFFDQVDVFASNDFFLNSYTDTTGAAAIGVKTLRDGYENLQTPFVVVKPLLPPINFTGSST